MKIVNRKYKSIIFMVAAMMFFCSVAAGKQNVIDIDELLSNGKVISNKDKEIVLDVKIGSSDEQIGSENNLQYCPSSFYVNGEDVFVIDNERNSIAVFRQNVKKQVVRLKTDIMHTYSEIYKNYPNDFYIGIYANGKNEMVTDAVRISVDVNDDGLDGVKRNEFMKSAEKLMRDYTEVSDEKYIFDFASLTDNRLLLKRTKGKREDVIVVFDQRMMNEKELYVNSQKILLINDKNIICMISCIPGDAKLYEYEKRINIVLVLDMQGGLKSIFKIGNGTICMKKDSFFCDDKYVYQMYLRDDNVIVDKFMWN